MDKLEELGKIFKEKIQEINCIKIEPKRTVLILHYDVNTIPSKKVNEHMEVVSDTLEDIFDDDDMSFLVVPQRDGQQHKFEAISIEELKKITNIKINGKNL